MSSSQEKTNPELGAYNAFVKLLENKIDPHLQALGWIIKEQLRQPLLNKYRGDKKVGIYEAWHDFLLEIHSCLPSIVPRNFVLTNKNKSKSDILRVIDKNLLNKWPPRRNDNAMVQQRHLQTAYAAYFWAHVKMGDDFTLAANEIDRILLGSPFEEIFGAKVQKYSKPAIAMVNELQSFDFGDRSSKKMPARTFMIN